MRSTKESYSYLRINLVQRFLNLKVTDFFLDFSFVAQNFYKSRILKIMNLFMVFIVLLDVKTI